MRSARVKNEALAESKPQTQNGESPFSRRLPVGAEVQPLGGVHFRVWAPACQKVEVVLEHTSSPTASPNEPWTALQGEGNGYFSGFVAAASNSSLYRYRLDEKSCYPDPASRFQPEGPHGPSQVVDPGLYVWQDRTWKGADLEGRVLYELHLGTFSREGTWAGAQAHLPRLFELGITTVEVMPVAEFSGSYGWGYDGVDLFAPFHHYGTPDDFRQFVDRAHQLGLGVILDVVYNHFGPDGCYHHAFSSHYLHHEKGSTDWGDALNFDGLHSGPAREYFIANAGYWISEFHLDGLRLDATHAIHDSSETHLLAEVSRHAREVAGKRKVILFAENESQNVRLIRPLKENGYGLDALWNDDFQHAARVALTGRAEGYYADYRGTPQELISAVKWSYLFQGQHCRWQQKLRGSSTAGIDSHRFVSYLENHDQVANSARGLRVKDLTSPGCYRAMATLWLLAPQTPMFFQGQELGSSRPFVYFSDHAEELAKLVKKGRAAELSGFRSTIHPDLVAWLEQAAELGEFQNCKLEDPDDYHQNVFFLLFQDLLRLRREDPIFRAQCADRIHGAVLGPAALAIRFFGDGPDCRLLLVNLGGDLDPIPRAEPLLAPPSGSQWSQLWYSEHPRYGGSSIPPLEPGNLPEIPGHCAIVLSPSPCTRAVEEPKLGSTIVEDFHVHPALRANKKPKAPSEDGENQGA